MTAAELAALKDDYAHALARGDYETAANIAVSLSACPGEPFGSWKDRAHICRRRATCSVCIAPSVVFCPSCFTPWCSHHATEDEPTTCSSCGTPWFPALLELSAALAAIEVRLAISAPSSLLSKGLVEAQELGADREQIAKASARGRRRRETERVRRMEAAAK